MSRSARVWLGLILSLAAFLRFGGLGQRALWLDERTTAGVVTGALLSDRIGSGPTFTAADFWNEATPGAVLEASIRADAGNGVLYSLLVNGWARLAGGSVAALRLPSALFGLLTVVLVYGFARRFLSETGALWATALAALHPFLVRYSQEARAYSLATFLGLLATCFFLRIAQDQNKDGRPSRAWIGYGLAAGGAFLTHYLTVYVLLAHTAGCGLFLRERFRWRQYLAGVLLAGALAGPWLLTGGREGASLMRSLDHHYRARAEQVAAGETWALPVTPRNVGAGWTQVGLVLMGNRLQAMGQRMVVLLPLLGVAGLLAACGVRAFVAADARRGGWLLLSAAAAPAFSTLLALRSGHMIPFSAQYALFSVPFMLVLLAGGAEGVLSRSRSPAVRAAGGLGLAVHGVVLLASLGTVVQDLPGTRPPDPHAEAVAWAARLIRPGDRVLYPSWEAARLCNLHLRRDTGWVQAIDPEEGAIRVMTAAGQVRGSRPVSEF